MRQSIVPVSVLLSPVELRLWDFPSETGVVLEAPRVHGVLGFVHPATLLQHTAASSPSESWILSHGILRLAW